MEVDPEYKGLPLTDKGLSFLKGEDTLQLREDGRTPAQRQQPARGPDERGVVSDTDKPFYDALRSCRTELARAAKIPPFMIFHNATLIEMMERRPENRDEMLRINGVGPVKFEKYGEAFLEVIRRFKPRGTKS